MEKVSAPEMNPHLVEAYGENNMRNTKQCPLLEETALLPEHLSHVSVAGTQPFRQLGTEPGARAPFPSFAGLETSTLLT